MLNDSVAELDELRHHRTLLSEDKPCESSMQKQRGMQLCGTMRERFSFAASQL